MTEEQATIIKRLSEKYHFSPELPQAQMLAYIGVGLGLSIEQIDSYLEPSSMNIMDRHYQMLLLALHIEESEIDWGGQADSSTGQNDVTPLEKLQSTLASHYLPSDRDTDTDYRQLMQYILDHAELSAPKIALLRDAAAKHIPQKEILKLARSHKDTMELQRSIEFYEVIRGGNGAGRSQKSKHWYQTLISKFRSRTPKYRLDKMSRRNIQTSV